MDRSGIKDSLSMGGSDDLEKLENIKRVGDLGYKI
jgi:hypothetical protein